MKMNDKSVEVISMFGPFEYNKQKILELVAAGKNGNYRTGYLNDAGDFVPKYTGRGNVFSRLNAYIDEGFKDSHFEFLYEPNDVASYKIESADYHRFNAQLRNEIHPRKPDGDGYFICPYCGE